MHRCIHGLLSHLVYLFIVFLSSWFVFYIVWVGVSEEPLNLIRTYEHGQHGRRLFATLSTTNQIKTRLGRLLQRRPTRPTAYRREQNLSLAALAHVSRRRSRYPQYCLGSWAHGWYSNGRDLSKTHAEDSPTYEGRRKGRRARLWTRKWRHL